MYGCMERTWNLGYERLSSDRFVPGAMERDVVRCLTLFTVSPDIQTRKRWVAGASWLRGVTMDDLLTRWATWNEVSAIYNINSQIL